MRFAVAAVTLAGVAAAQNATASDVYVTDVVTAYTTFCPEATQITHAGQTYTVSQATTLTITNCPGGCTITRPASYISTPVVPTTTPVAPVTESSSSAPVPTAYTSSSSVSVAPFPYSSSSVASAVVPYPSSNGTAPGAYSSGTASPNGSSSTSTSSPYTGAGSKTYASAGAGFLALFGLVAAL